MASIVSKPRTFSNNTGLLTLLRLKEDQCKWPVGHDATAVGGYLFCGRQTKGQPYCVKHERLNRSTKH